jgi:hypothetical protein
VSRVPLAGREFHTASSSSGSTGAGLRYAPSTATRMGGPIQTYRWQKNGTDLTGPNTHTFTPTVSGNYTCEETATNQAGSTSQTSPVKKVK